MEAVPWPMKTTRRMEPSHATKDIPRHGLGGKGENRTRLTLRTRLLDAVLAPQGLGKTVGRLGNLLEKVVVEGSAVNVARGYGRSERRAHIQ